MTNTLEKCNFKPMANAGKIGSHNSQYFFSQNMFLICTTNMFSLNLVLLWTARPTLLHCWLMIGVKNCIRLVFADQTHLTIVGQNSKISWAQRKLPKLVQHNRFNW